MEDNWQDSLGNYNNTRVERMRRVEQLRLEGRRVRPESEAEIARQETRKAIADNLDILGAMALHEHKADGIKINLCGVNPSTFLRGDRYTDYFKSYVVMELWSDTSEDNWLHYLRFRLFDNDALGPCVILERNEDNCHLDFAWERVLGPYLFPIAEEKAQALLHDLQKVIAEDSPKYR